MTTDRKDNRERTHHPLDTRHRVDELVARLKRIPREAWMDALDCNDEAVAFRAIAMTLVDLEDEATADQECICGHERGDHRSGSQACDWPQCVCENFCEVRHGG